MCVKYHISFLFLFFSFYSYGQFDSNCRELNSFDFNEFVQSVQSSKDSVLNYSNLYLLSECVIDRFQNGQFTFSNNILDIANFHLELAKLEYGPDRRLSSYSRKSVRFFLDIIALSKYDSLLNEQLINSYLNLWFFHEFTGFMSISPKLNRETNFEELLKLSVENGDKIRKNAVYNYVNQNYKLGLFYQYKAGEEQLAEPYFIKVVSYPIQFEPDKELKTQLYKIYTKASEGLLYLRRNNSEMLERTFFYGDEKASLEKLKEYYLKNN